MQVDAHQHYWDPARGDYPWMPEAPASLQHTFAPADLDILRAPCGIEATVLVQAAPTVAETDYLLALARTAPSVRGVVGWVDFARPEERATLDRLAADPLLVALRPMVQDIPDDDWVLQPDLAWAFAALQERGLAFDALGFPRHARRFLRLCERHPDLRVVADHGMKPRIAQREFDAWAADMRDLARHTDCRCKLSGLASEAEPGAGAEVFRPYVEHLLDVFGAHRLMWGSDWPVASATIGYATWYAICRNLLEPLGPDERDRVFGANAIDFYRLPLRD